MQKSCLYFGEVMHQRFHPVGHRFVYRVASLALDLGEVEGLNKEVRFFSFNRFNLFSVLSRDLGDGKVEPTTWAEATLARFGLDPGPNARYCVHLFPRFLGLGFSPLTLWLCFRGDETLMAILYEVHNTFGERHVYLVPISEAEGKRMREGGTLHHRADKIFHVSPFVGMAARYDFSLRLSAEKLALLIEERDHESGQIFLIARHIAKRIALTDKSLVTLSLRYPFLPLKIIGGIHWEALQLWRKGVSFHHKPPPPSELVSFSALGESDDIRID